MWLLQRPEAVTAIVDIDGKWVELVKAYSVWLN